MGSVGYVGCVGRIKELLGRIFSPLPTLASTNNYFKTYAVLGVPRQRLIAILGMTAHPNTLSK